MQDSSSLPIPVLPQMEDDGYITDVELQGAQGVIVDVNRYTLAEPGDYLGLYWDGRLFGTLLLTDPDTQPWPWTVIVPQEYAQDGPHQIWYTVTDAAQNPSASPVALGCVDRTHTDGLPPPTFPDADSHQTITYDSVLLQQGTHVHVPWSDGAFSTGDTVYVYWRELDAQGETAPDSQTSVTHTVAATDLTSGFNVLIAPSFVTTLTAVGTAEAWYSVIPLSGSSAQSSQTGTINVDMSGTGGYPAPTIPAGNDGWINCSEITTNGIDVDIPANAQFYPGGTVEIHWQGYTASGGIVADTAYQLVHTLSANDVATGFSIAIPANRILPIGIGYAQAWYVVNAPSVPGVSSLAQVQVDTEHCSLLPPPVFPDASGDNTLSLNDVTTNNGTDMRIAWSGMVAGDTVTAYWSGYLTTPDDPLPGTSWMETRTLTGAEAQAQVAIFHIPAGYITPVGSGYGEGRYQVMFRSGGLASSQVQDVIVSTAHASGLVINCTTGAPVFDPTIAVRPLNTVSVSGPAGAEVELAVPASSDARFDPDGVQTLRLRLDETGYAFTQVYSFAPGNVLISAYIVSTPNWNVSESMTFMAWLPGQGELAYYGIAIGALADGTQPCTVYLQSSPSSAATQAKLSLNGASSAVITVSGIQTAWLNISNHAGGFNVTDTTSESVAFTLSLPDTGAYITGVLPFIEPQQIHYYSPEKMVRKQP